MPSQHRAVPSASIGRRRLSRRVAMHGIGAGGVVALGAGRTRLRAKAERQAEAATPVAATPAATPPAPESPVVRSAPQVFDYDAFQFEFLIGLGGTFERAADIGECFATAAQIPTSGEPDFDAWFDAWYATADRLRGIAEESDAKGHVVSAAEAYLRASTYYSMAYFFADGTSDPSRLVPTWEAHRACFDAFAERLNPRAEPVSIPYEGTTLPGYALTVDDSGRPRPWLILNNGSDGTATDMWVLGAAAALRRGYNALIFDGPGQGAALFRQNLYFRPDWEAVITPVVDFLLSRPDVDPDRIALSGVSQGGYWVARAVAFEHRIAAAILDPGVWDVASSWTSQLPPEVAEAFDTLQGAEFEEFKREFDQGVAEEMAGSAVVRFMMTFRTRPFGTSSMAEVIEKLKDYNLEGVAEHIQCPVLILDPEGEDFWPGQSRQVYDALSSPKTLVEFTAAQGADLHVEPKAAGLRTQVIFDWLDETMNVGG